MEIDTWYCEYARISCRVLGWRIGTTFSISFIFNWTIRSRQKFPESKAWILVKNLHSSIRISLQSDYPHSYFYQNQTVELSLKRVQLHQLVSRLADTDNFGGFGCDLCQEHCDWNQTNLSVMDSHQFVLGDSDRCNLPRIFISVYTSANWTN